ncbi:hypothetical protein JOC33_002032 [Thalassobacillus pellis]|nr:hypothetical protein [Thalassobacillus pellis]
MKFRVVSNMEKGCQVVFCSNNQERIFSTRQKAQQFLQHIKSTNLFPDNYTLQIESITSINKQIFAGKVEKNPRAHA